MHKNYFTLLNKDNFDPAVMEFLAQINEAPVIYDDRRRMGYTYKKSGLEVMFLKQDNGLILQTIFLYSEDWDGFAQYEGELPDNLRFLEDAKHTRELLGIPSRSGRLQHPDQSCTSYDRYDQEPYYVHLEFDEPGLLRKLSIGLLTDNLRKKPN